MAVESSTTTFKADITNFKSAMSEAARLVRQANSEFKAATAGMEKWSSTTDGLTAKTKQLQTVLSAQERQLDVLKAAYEKVAKEEGEDSKGAQELTIKINNQTAAIKSTQAELDKYEKELDEAGKENKELADDVNKSTEAVEKAKDGFTVMKGVLANLVAEGIRMACSALKDLATEAFNVGSQFEASMSKVAAVSGANAEEMEQLTAKAKQMGETTIFSASQSADAFNYMAMAGWKTEEMLNGIEGVMNLAAASGSDLATTSDIVTDALTAFGLTASDAGHFADVLAAASSNANTNVNMMGETFKYAAPIAGALGYSIEDTAVAIGLMANAGIKSSQAGTALRKILTQLNGEVKVTGKEFGTLAIETTNADGSMRPLADILTDLRSAFSKMTDSEKAANAETIAGKTAMSGLLAMVNATEKDFTKLTSAIDSSTGAAERMARTMTDNVQGQLTLLKSNIEGKMIQVFEAAAPAIRSAITEIGNAINSLDMDSIAKGVAALAKTIGELIAFVIKNGGTIISILQTIGTVMLTVFVVNKLGAFVGMVNALVSAYGSLNAVVLLLQKSQLLLNAAQLASPLGITIGLIAAATAGIIAYTTAQNEAVKAEYGLSDAEKELQNQIHSSYEAQQEMVRARDNSIESITGEYNRISELKNEYNSLIDVNGNVKAGYEDRAAFILNELANAMGVEKDKILELIDTNGQLGKSIDELIQKKQAEATLGAYEDSYKTAKAKEKEAIENVVNAQNNATESEQKYNSVLQEYIPIAAEAERYLSQGIPVTGELGDKYSYLSKAVKEAEESYNSNKTALEEANKTYVDYQTTIQNYEGLATSIIRGDSNEIQASLTNLTDGFKTATSATQEQLEQQVRDCEKYYQDIQAAMAAGNPVITKTMVQGAAEMVSKAKAELENFKPAATEASASGLKAFVNSINSASSEVQSSTSAIAAVAQKGLESAKSEEAGKKVGTEYTGGLRSVEGESNTAGVGVANAAEQGLESVDPTPVGVSFGNKFVSGVESAMDGAVSRINAKLQNILANIQKAKEEMESLNKNPQGLNAGNSTKKKLDIAGATTYKAFLQDFLGGVAAQESIVANAIKGIATTALNTLKGAINGKYSEIAKDASSLISKSLTGNLQYMTARINYENEQQIARFDTKIKALEAKRDKELKGEEDSKKQESIRKKYQKLIDIQNNYKKAYQTASKQMISELQSALSDYEKAATALVNDTINEITTKYNEKYDKLIAKQNSLVDKLKSASTLFNISGAGIMTVNDLNKQTQQIAEYTDKLKRIKDKVSAELFDEITSFDMKEGSAFLDRLLGMSDADLAAYNQAYVNKVNTIAGASEDLYKKDIDKVASDYQTELERAFADLPATLEQMGVDAMKGFVNGLTKNTDYMADGIKSFVNSMVKQFKTLLKISSPSKVMFSLGEFTGEGLADGIVSMKSAVKQAAGQLADAVRTPINGVSVGGVGNTNVTNNYNLVQNNTSPKALTALETYQARRQQIALIKAFG